MCGAEEPPLELTLGNGMFAALERGGAVPGPGCAGTGAGAQGLPPAPAEQSPVNPFISPT